MIIGGNHIEICRKSFKNKSLRTVSTYRIAGYKTATKFVRNLCTARNAWIIWTKCVSRVHFITLNQSPRLEWESLFSYKGKPLPYMPFCYQHPDYWRIISEESKRTGNMIASRKLFDDSEAAHPITEEEFIKVENIRGKLFLVGAEDDALWDTAKYIRRMEKRLAEKPHSCEVEAVVYEHGTHFVFPDGMLKTMLPVGSALFVKLAFSAAKKYPRECKTARIDIDRRMTRVICDWRDKK